MTHLTSRGLIASRTLISTTVLQHNPVVSQAFDIDRREIDLEALEDWRWSSGELVLVDLLRAFATSYGGPPVEDLLKLDLEHRQAVLEALSRFLLEQEALA
jgi:hypothetical protein